MNPRQRLIAQFCVAIICLIGGGIYPLSLALANLRTAGQVSATGPATDALLYNPPTFAVVATLILLPIGAIVAFVTFAEAAAIRRRDRR